jgi:hypothetical protein
VPWLPVSDGLEQLLQLPDHEPSGIPDGGHERQDQAQTERAAHLLMAEPAMTTV